MPTVPNSNVVRLRASPATQLPEVFLLMAAADMHEKGLLVETMPDLTQDSTYEKLKGVESDIEQMHSTPYNEDGEVAEITEIKKSRTQDI